MSTIWSFSSVHKRAKWIWHDFMLVIYQLRLRHRCHRIQRRRSWIQRHYPIPFRIRNAWACILHGQRSRRDNLRCVSVISNRYVYQQTIQQSVYTNLDLRILFCEVLGNCFSTGFCQIPIDLRFQQFFLKFFLSFLVVFLETRCQEAWRVLIKRYSVRAWYKGVHRLQEGDKLGSWDRKWCNGLGRHQEIWWPRGLQLRSSCPCRASECPPITEAPHQLPIPHRIRGSWCSPEYWQECFIDKTR